MPSPYVLGLYQNVMLIDAGFPFRSEDFSLDYWLDLSILRQAIRQKTGRCPLI